MRLVASAEARRGIPPSGPRSYFLDRLRQDGINAIDILSGNLSRKVVVYSASTARLQYVTVYCFMFHLLRWKLPKKHRTRFLARRRRRPTLVVGDVMSCSIPSHTYVQYRRQASVLQPSIPTEIQNFERSGTGTWYSTAPPCIIPQCTRTQYT